ncbi:hypothetical protein [Prauserella muralis]|uniref:Uncharacterized protein n=1 Tax=Prauserella muralis TaxID=588067 RepID=A0A2V4B8C8_9PSEU|nr:hypothetical protein [Prauserella muralis]PXY31500.1 hypothetical protein BAY60_03755 [Prauserella muralis]TWE14152.1 hypothetical protein FHX69_6289 [Prauserella muralis]
MSDDPERLLAEALRAQARNAPPRQQATPRPEPLPVVETPGGYGLLSGAGEGSLERERAALDAQAPPAPAPPPPRTSAGTAAQAAQHTQAGPLRLRWVLLLALLLGLAAGSVAGVLTLL